MKPDINNLTWKQKLVTHRLRETVSSIPAEGPEFAVIGSDEELLCHIVIKAGTDKARVANRLRDIANQIEEKE